jgi:hypothetical protein
LCDMYKKKSELIVFAYVICTKKKLTWEGSEGIMANCIWSKCSVGALRSQWYVNCLEELIALENCLK